MFASAIYSIPKQTQIIVVSDLFMEDLPNGGGAEQTTQAVIEILENKSVSVFRLRSVNLTERLVEANKDKIWLLGNWAQAPLEGTTALVRNGCRYYILEMDYKYCKYRSSHLHELQENKPCDCNEQRQGKFVEAFYLRAQHVFFMSAAQLSEYSRLFPRMSGQEKFSVLSSVWSSRDLEYIIGLAQTTTTKSKIDKWAILSGGSWIKNQQATEQYCRNISKKYELIGGLPYKDFLKELSKFGGLVFHPLGFDTCPRLVVEAKLLGLKLDLNENVQISKDNWLTGDIDTCLRYLQEASNRLLSKVML